MKDKVLEILVQHKGEAVSGSEIGQRLGLTRAAVWKSIRALKEEGYHITAGTNRGYCLAADTDLISEAGIRQYLRTKILGNRILYYPLTDSTNIQLKRAAQEQASAGLVAVAEEQTAGRGRFSRNFYSPRDNGVYMSVLLRPDFDAAQAALLTSAAAVCVSRAIEALTDCEVGIKWVNDLFVDGKKVCGILTEAAMEFESRRMEYAVVGIGVNMTAKDLPAELQEIVGGIDDHGGRPERNRLIAEILNQLEEMLEDFKREKFLPEYRQRSIVLGRRVNVLQSSEAEPGTALEIDDDARLVVRMDSGEVRHLNSGEISCRLI